MRYRYFRQLLLEGRLNRIATGHTLDDQAETVLLKMVRGAGTRGLAGIYPQLSVSGVAVARILMLLSFARCLESDGKTLRLICSRWDRGWREDQSNRDLRHMRNRVRHGILPRLERYLNPAVREALAETAEIARAEEEYWQKEVARVLPQVWKQTTPVPSSYLTCQCCRLASGAAAARGPSGQRIFGLAAGFPSRRGGSRRGVEPRWIGPNSTVLPRGMDGFAKTRESCASNCRKRRTRRTGLRIPSFRARIG